MDTKVVCVYNRARGVFLSSKVTVADNADQPLKMLKVLVSGLALDAESGFWLSPLHATPSVPRLFPFDLVYLDRDHQVVDLAEVFPGGEIPSYRREVASALVLPLQTVQLTQTARGDRLIIGDEVEIEGQLGAIDTFLSESGASRPKALENGHGDLKTSEKEEAESASAESAAPLALEPAAAETESGVLVGEGNAGEASEHSFFAQLPTSDGQLDVAEIAAAIGAGNSIEAEAPVIAITEVVLERPPAPVINGQHGCVEDLFSNWVDEPSMASAWIARNPVSPTRRTDESEKRPLPAAGEVLAAATQAGTSKEATVAKRDPAPAKKVAAATTPLAVSAQTQTSTPQPPIAATFTVAQYGLWQAGTATAVSPPVSGEGSFAKRSSGGIQSNGAGTKAKASAPAAADTQAASAAVTASTRGEKAAANGTKPAVKAAGAAGQVPAAEAPVMAPDKAEKPQREVPKAETEAMGVQSAEAAQKQPAESKEMVKATSAASKPPEGKKEAASTPQSELSLTLPLPAMRKTEQKGKLKISIQRVDANGKAKEQPLSLGMRFKRWLNPVAPANSDRRRAHRRYVPGMIAYYYTGGAPKPHEVADISMTGFYLVTEDRWMPDTMIQMTLQKPCARGERKQSIAVLSKIVRRGSDGVAAEFVMPESLDPTSQDVHPSQTTDRFSLARFL